MQALNTGWQYLQWGAQTAKQKAEEAKLAEKLSNATQSIKQTAQERGWDEMAKNAATKAKLAADKAANYTYESGQSIYKSAQEGSLQEKTKEKASKAGDMMGQLGQSLFNKVNQLKQQNRGEQADPAQPDSKYSNNPYDHSPSNRDS
mmetsp:Transcript_11163/g.18750  ORF Transcript_11163/g.18750 Transcript_11163/m.18750 type:complete len:147 (-) Transcript_11163:49-489(-)